MDDQVQLLTYYEEQFKRIAAWMEINCPEYIEVNSRDDTNKTIADVVIEVLERWKPETID